MPTIKEDVYLETDYFLNNILYLSIFNEKCPDKLQVLFKVTCVLCITF